MSLVIARCFGNAYRLTVVTYTLFGLVVASCLSYLQPYGALNALDCGVGWTCAGTQQ